VLKPRKPPWLFFWRRCLLLFLLPCAWQCAALLPVSCLVEPLPRTTLFGLITQEDDDGAISNKKREKKSKRKKHKNNNYTRNDRFCCFSAASLVVLQCWARN
jgi:hypothetical protein